MQNDLSILNVVVLESYKRIENRVSKTEFPDLYAHLKHKMSHCLSELAYFGNRESNLLMAMSLGEEAITVIEKADVSYQIEIPLGLSTVYLALAGIRDTELYQREAAAILDKLTNDSTVKHYADNPLLLRLSGDSYRTLAQVRNPEDNYRKAIRAYERSLEVLGRDTTSLTFAITQNNLAATYAELAQVTYRDRAENLRAAREAYKNAANVFTIEYDPIRYANILNNMGLAYWNLAEVEDRNANLDSAVQCYGKALQVRSKTKFPFEYAATINNIASALIKYDSGTAAVKGKRLRRARDLLLEASEIINMADYPLNYAQTQNNLGIAYLLLGAIEEKEINLERAKSSLDNSLQVYTVGRYPSFYRRVKAHLGDVYAAMSMFKDSQDNLRRATSSYEECLGGITIKGEPTTYGVLQSKIGNLYYTHHSVFRREADRIAAEEAYLKAIEAYRIDGNSDAIVAAQSRIREMREGEGK